MPTRREFIGSVLGTAVLSGCSKSGQGSESGTGKEKAASPAERASKSGTAPPAKALEPKKEAPEPPDEPNLEGPGDDHVMATPTLREKIVPSLKLPSDDALANIRKLERKTPDLVEVSGSEPAVMLLAGLTEFGAGKPLVRRGDRVVLTPNFALARPVHTGVSSDSELVKTMIQYCFKAGAREVTCLDHSYSAVPRAFRVNGAYEAVRDTGARLISPWSPDQYVVINDFSAGKLHRTELKWQAVPEVLLRADVLINMPIFKHHRDAMMSGAVKKLMGLIWRRAVYHETDLHGCIGELASIIRPTVTVMEAQNILSTNGPDGPGKMKAVNRLLVSTDMVLADSYACRWLDLDPDKVGYLTRAAQLKAGSMDADKASVVRLKA